MTARLQDKPLWLVQRPPHGDESPTWELIRRACDALQIPVEREIVSGSFYRPDADARLPRDLLEFAREAISTWVPAEVFMLDVARAEGTYRIVEANCFNGARFYGADVLKVVERVSAFQRARW